MSKGPTYYPNKYPGVCEWCGQIVRPRTGRVRRNRYFQWFTTHWPAIELGWPPRREGGCPPKPTDTDPTPPADLTPAQARERLYRAFYATDGDAPHAPYSDPDTQAEEDTIMVGLAARKPLDLYHDPGSYKTLIGLARRHGWADPR